MPAAVGNNFHRVIGALMTAADLAAGFGFVALNLDLTAGQTALINAIDFSVSATGADYNNLQFVQVFIFKNINLSPGLPTNSQISAGTETLYNQFTAFLSERVFHREWQSPFPLEGPGRYAVFGQAFFGAFVGPSSYGMNVAGRIVPSGSVQELPPLR